jgi:hypothetical protein
VAAHAARRAPLAGAFCGHLQWDVGVGWVYRRANKKILECHFLYATKLKEPYSQFIFQSTIKTNQSL